MERLQENLIYYDTNSAVSGEEGGRQDIHQYITIAVYSEIKPDDYIASFLSLGCKSYAFATPKAEQL